MTQIVPPSRIAVIGIGKMGAPIASRLIDAGYDVSIFDAYEAALEPFRERSCRIASSATEAARDAAALITILPTGPDVRAALFGENGAVAGLTSSAIVIDMSTIDVSDSRTIAEELKRRGLHMVDAPVARTPEHAWAGTLLALVGGNAEDVEAVHPVLDCFSEKIFHLGVGGTGITLKLINNYMSMVGMVLAAEGLAMAGKAGIDRQQAVELLSLTPAGKGQLTTNYPRKVLQGDVTPDFPLRMGLKDLNLALALGQQLSSPTALGAAAQSLFGLARAWKREEQDCTAMLLLLEDVSNSFE